MQSNSSFGFPSLKWFYTPSPSLPPIFFFLSSIFSDWMHFPKSKLQLHRPPTPMSSSSCCDWFLSWSRCYYHHMTFLKDPTIKTYTRDIFFSSSPDLKWLSISFMFFPPSTKHISAKPLILSNTLIKKWISELHRDQLTEDDTKPRVIHLCRSMKKRDYISFK